MRLQGMGMANDGLSTLRCKRATLLRLSPHREHPRIAAMEKGWRLRNRHKPHPPTYR